MARLPRKDEVCIHVAVRLNVKFAAHFEQARAAYAVAELLGYDLAMPAQQLKLAEELHAETVEMLKYHAQKN